MGAVKWTEAFWKERVDLCNTDVIPAQWNYFMVFSQPNFEFIANKPDNHEGYKGSYWQDGDFYK